MTSAIDSSFISTGPVSKSSMRLALDTAASEITALQTAVVRASTAANILDYGGISNGTGDNTPAVTAAIAAGKRSIFFPAGTYQFTTGCTINTPVYMFGEGHNTIIKPSGTITMMTFGGGHAGSIVEDMYINGGAAHTGAGATFVVNTADRISFRRLWGDPRNFLKVQKCNTCYVSDMWMSNCKGTYWLYWYGDAGNRSDLLAMRHLFIGLNSVDRPTGLDWDGQCYSLDAQGVHFVSAGYAFRIRNSSGGPVPSIGRMYGCAADAPSQHGVSIETAVADLDIIAGYYAGSTSGSGIYIDGSVGTDEVRIIGGKCTGNARYGIEGGAVVQQIVDDVYFAANTIGQYLNVVPHSASPRHNADTTFYFDITTGSPVINLDTNDYISYNRGTNTLGVTIGGASKLQLDTNRLYNPGLVTYGTVFTKAGLPSAVTYANTVAMISDGTSNRQLVVSDGAIWRYMDGTAV